MHDKSIDGKKEVDFDQIGTLVNEMDPDIDSKELVYEIKKLAKIRELSEPAAVTVMGYLMKIYNRPFAAITANAQIEILRKKEIDNMSEDECQLLLAAGILQRIKPPFRSGNKNIGRNDLCPCGSGQKYKKCCLELAQAHDLERYKNG